MKSYEARVRFHFAVEDPGVWTKRLKIGVIGTLTIVRDLSSCGVVSESCVVVVDEVFCTPSVQVFALSLVFIEGRAISGKGSKVSITIPRLLSVLI